MEKLDLSSMGVQEMNTLEIKEKNGGVLCDITWLFDLIQVLEWSIEAGKKYVKYSAETGGQYVIHHAV